MNIMIEIECETIADLVAHLRVLENNIIKQSNINNQNMRREDFAIGTKLYDDNCYGTHELSVIEVVE